MEKTRERIALVEDDDLINSLVTLNLQRQGFEVDSHRQAETLLAAIAPQRYDLVILDIMLPGMDGLEALHRIRGRGVTTPVLMLTARSDLQTKLESFEGGSDDYLAKPFDMQELTARVRALIRRSQGARSLPAAGLLTVGGFPVNRETRQAQSNLGPVLLSEKEMNLLLLFCEHPRATFSRADIPEEVWGMEVDPTPRTVDNFVMKLRKLFEEKPEHPRHFITVRSAGYRFEP